MKFIHLTLWDGRKIAIRNDQVLQWYEVDRDDDAKESDKVAKCVIETSTRSKSIIIDGDDNNISIPEDDDSDDIEVLESFEKISMLLEGE